MLMLLNRVSYRSVLALSLFAQTPVPVGVGEEEELNGLSAPICMHTALMHVQKLRQQCFPGRLFLFARSTGDYWPCSSQIRPECDPSGCKCRE